MFEGLDVFDLVIGVVATVVTLGLGVLYKKAGSKLDEAVALLDYILEAASDRQLTKDELQEIWKRVQVLRRKDPEEGL